MSLRYGILGLLSKWEASGYDIKKEFDDVMSIFWHSHLSQIYPELNKLEKEKLISSRLIQQEGKPDKKVYSITESGRNSLVEWLIGPIEEPKLKDAFLMQTFFMDNIPVDEVLLKLNMYKKERQYRLEKMKEIIQEKWNSIKERNIMKPRIIVSSAVLKRGIEQELQYIKWCEDTIQLVEGCKHLWDQDEHILTKDSNTESHSEEGITFTDVKDTFLHYFSDLIDDE
ncbi:PadR family transcriptional regulator [Cytobacillus massiliigabonensis]|uniref:PadR family transcriptional regulator n=1 Tax=Cytobacillus massiliigabonensis TaxID=1871011 RepID=UPI000C834F34|nr:PadR family transcriptional regulator [Cytobacillus massiliigabonensis]